MLRVEVNSKAKADRIILALGKRSKSWQAYYDSINDRETYLVFYKPMEV